MTGQADISHFGGADIGRMSAGLRELLLQMTRQPDLAIGTIGFGGADAAAGAGPSRGGGAGVRRQPAELRRAGKPQQPIGAPPAGAGHPARRRGRAVPDVAAPMAWCGAILAHDLFGMPLSMESLVGMVAASGVVVNDSMVLLDYIHEHRQRAHNAFSLIAEACTARFRPIFLAFLTNFAGFLPTLLETSVQAQFLVPMTLSLAAGLMFGMAASLLLTPVCYAVLQDFYRKGGHAG